MQISRRNLAYAGALIAAAAVLSGCGLTKDRIVNTPPTIETVFKDKIVNTTTTIVSTTTVFAKTEPLPDPSLATLMFTDYGKDGSFIEKLKDSASILPLVDENYVDDDNDGSGDKIASLNFSAARSSAYDTGDAWIGPRKITINFNGNELLFTKSIAISETNGGQVSKVVHSDFVFPRIDLKKHASQYIDYEDDNGMEKFGRKGSRYIFEIPTEDEAYYVNIFEYLNTDGSINNDANKYGGGYGVKLRISGGNPSLLDAETFAHGEDLLWSGYDLVPSLEEYSGRFIKGPEDGKDGDDEVLWYSESTFKDRADNAPKLIDGTKQLVATYMGQTDGAYSRKKGSNDATSGGFWGDIELTAKILAKSTKAGDPKDYFGGTISGEISDIEYASFASILTSPVLAGSGTSLGNSVKIKLDDAIIDKLGTFSSESGDWSGVFSKLKAANEGPSSVYGTYGIEYEKAADDTFFFIGFFGLPRTSSDVLDQ